MSDSPTVRKKLIIIGAGGLGQEIAWTAGPRSAAQPEFELCGFCDDDGEKQGKAVDGLPVLGTIEECAGRHEGALWFICSVGNNRDRQAVAARAERMGWQAASVIDPTVVIGTDVVVQEGVYVGAFAILSPHSRVGRHAVINQMCTVGHHSRLDDYVHLCPGSRVSGHCKLGRRSFMGSNAVLGPGAELGEDATLGAASFAPTDVPPHATAVGNPARVLFRTAK